MASITTASRKIEYYPTKFAYPYGDEGNLPLYSSIPLQVGEMCMPCSTCVNANTISDVLASQEEYSNKLNGQYASTNGLVGEVIISEYR